MIKKSFLQQIFFGFTALFLIISCDKGFNEFGTDIVGDDHFDFEKYSDVTVKAYNQKLGAISSNNLPINPLGFYYNPAFGTTHANFVTQVELKEQNPTFNNVNPANYQTPTVIDSVVLNIPYYSKLLPNLDENGNKVYRLDSIYGVSESKFQLSVYQSNYYLRDLDPSQALSQAQLFYTDMDTEIDNNKIGAPLNDLPMSDPRNSEGQENSFFFFDKREHKTITYNASGGEVPNRSVPSMRLHLNKTVFTNLLLNAPSGQLVNNAVFKNYFRGLYFKVAGGNPGQMAMLNFKNGGITVYYNEDKKKTTNGVVTFTRENKSLLLNMTGNSISLLNNSNENTDYLNAANNTTTEAGKLYLKGGEGAISVIDLFGQADNYKYIIKLDGNGNQVNDAEGDPLYVKVFSPNGVSDELDDLRYPPIDGSGVDHSIKKRWMVNDAQLTFTIDAAAMSDTRTIEPNRIFLYDLTNKKALADYSYDFTTNSAYPKFSKITHGGIIEKQSGTNGRGIKYRIRITNHIRNLIMKDSTNVRLGLSVTENIGNVGMSKLRTPNANSNSAPAMSVMNPLGTIIYGTNIPFGDVNYANRLKFDIYYTKPD